VIHIIRILKKTSSFFIFFFSIIVGTEVRADERYEDYVFPSINTILGSHQDGSDDCSFSLDLKFRAEKAFIVGSPIRSPYGGTGQVRGSFFWNSWLSFHGRAQGQFTKFAEKDWDVARDTKLLIMQLGNIGDFPFRLVIGRSQLPFGISEPILKGWFQTQFKKSYDDSPKNVAYLTWDNKVNFLIDLGVGYDSQIFKRPKTHSEEQRENKRALSIRFIYDFPILMTTRSLLSFYGQEDGKRRWSLGLITIGDRKEETQIDIIRELSTPDGKEDSFKQKIHFGFKSPIQNASRWSFELDDEKDFITVGAVYYEFNIFSYLWYTQGIGYRRVNDESPKRGWIFLMGLGTQL
jgi:hypothetical protein